MEIKEYRALQKELEAKQNAINVTGKFNIGLFTKTYFPNLLKQRSYFTPKRIPLWVRNSYTVHDRHGVNVRAEHSLCQQE